LKNLKGKNVLVTGAGGGIGKATAMMLAGEGCNLFLCDINEKQVNSAAAELISIGYEAHAYMVDVSDEKQVKTLEKNLKKKSGGIDIIVCNAGIGWTGPTHLMEREDWDRVLGVNLFGVIHFIRHFVPGMVLKKQGHVVIVSSIFGITGLPYGTLYASSKAALIALGECLRAELSFHNVGVTTICPGLIETGLIANTHFKGVDEKARSLSRKVKPMPVEKCAGIIVKSIKKNRGVTVITSLAKILWLIKRISQNLFEFIQKIIAGSTKEFVKS